MALSVADMYALRECPKLVLPQAVQDVISTLRRTAMVFKPFHKPQRHYHSRPKQPDNWREKLLVDMVRKVREREDPEYSEIFAIFNKIAPSNLSKLSNDTIALIQKRDDAFRLRVATLLFDKAITNHVYASVMADCALHLSRTIPEIIEDLETQVSMFDTLYNMSETITYTNDNVIAWTKQKEKRRGYAKFMTELFIRGLMSEDNVRIGLGEVANELQTMLNQESRSEQMDENIHQCAVFLFETAKLLKKNVYLQQMIIDILKSRVPMKTKFKLEDALKLVS
jgi:hypothetical protein